MTARIDTLAQFLLFERERYLKDAETHGGTAKGFRARIGKLYDTDRSRFDARAFEALMAAATNCWQKPPRKAGPDLFSIAGETLPQHFTRPKSYVDGDDVEDDDFDFEKVHQDFATVADMHDDALIKMRKAAQSAAKAEEDMKLADEARRRAKGKMTTFLHEIRDPPRAASAGPAIHPSV